MPPRQRMKQTFEHVSEMDKSRIIDLRTSGMSFRDIATNINRNAYTVVRVWKQYIDERVKFRRLKYNAHKKIDEKDEEFSRKLTRNEENKKSLITSSTDCTTSTYTT